MLRNSGIKVPHIAAPGARRSKWGHTLFVADYLGNVVQEFDPKPGGQVTATISDVVGPQGMDADSHGNLYVTSQGTAAVTVHTPGTYTASKILNEGNGQAPASVAVCPNGTVYVSNTYANSGFDLGTIEIFAPGSTSPTGAIADSNIYFSFFVACDAHGNVWYASPALKPEYVGTVRAVTRNEAWISPLRPVGSFPRAPIRAMSHTGRCRP